MHSIIQLCTKKKIGVVQCCYIRHKFISPVCDAVVHTSYTESVTVLKYVAVQSGISMQGGCRLVGLKSVLPDDCWGRYYVDVM